MQKLGCLFIISSPSGAGKTSITRGLLDEFGEYMVRLSVSVTTRGRRAGEIDGKDYYFISEDRYHQLQEAGDFLESAEIFGNKYATLKSEVEPIIANGCSVLFDIDWQGAQQLSKYSDDIVTLFILPPSIKELHSRLLKRNLDSQETIDKRMKKAKEEITHWQEYDYIIINDDLQNSIEKTRSILIAELAKRHRQPYLQKMIASL